MRYTVVLLALTVIAASVAQAAQRRSPPTFPGARTLLWVGAHPDDETIAAPLLGRLCVEERLSCTFLVITRGEAGQCRLADGCHPDLGAVRAAEMRRSAQLFGAQLTQWRLPDGGGMAGWAAAQGSLDGLVDQVAAVVRSVDPDVVLTFDPRHGSTCHGDHRAAADLVLQALDRVSRQPAVYLLETIVTGSTAPFTIRYAPAASIHHGTVGFDATPALSSTRASGWQFTVWVAQAHASQFTPSAVRGLSKLAHDQRVVYAAPAALALASDLSFSCN